MDKLLLVFLGELVLASCNSKTPTQPSPVQQAPPQPTTGLISFSSDANNGWTSIAVRVNGGSVAGNIRAYVEPNTPTSCTSSPGRVVV